MSSLLFPAGSSHWSICQRVWIWMTHRKLFCLVQAHGMNPGTSMMQQFQRRSMTQLSILYMTQLGLKVNIILAMDGLLTWIIGLLSESTSSGAKMNHWTSTSMHHRLHPWIQDTHQWQPKWWISSFKMPRTWSSNWLSLIGKHFKFWFTRHMHASPILFNTEFYTLVCTPFTDLRSVSLLHWYVDISWMSPESSQ